MKVLTTEKRIRKKQAFFINNTLLKGALAHPTPTLEFFIVL